jgi:hypothetical protein
MRHLTLTTLAGLIGVGMLVASPDTAAAQREAPPGGAHQTVSALVALVPGVYDYDCIPHEAAGMVGRIIVGTPLGPGTRPFDCWLGRPEAEGWRRVPDPARVAFPSITRILAERRVRPERDSRDVRASPQSPHHPTGGTG